MTTLDEILEQWDADTMIDPTELGEEARNIPRLHAKYLRMLSTEKMLLRQYDSLYRKLYVEKQEYYVEGPANLQEYEAKKTKWKQVPERGRSFIRTTVGQFLDADEDIDTLRLKRDICQTKIDALTLIMQEIMGRGFKINNMIQWAQWTGGGK